MNEQLMKEMYIEGIIKTILEDLSSQYGKRRVKKYCNEYFSEKPMVL